MHMYVYICICPGSGSFMWVALCRSIGAWGREFYSLGPTPPSSRFTNPCLDPLSQPQHCHLGQPDKAPF